MDADDMMEEYLSESSFGFREKKQKKVRTLVQLIDDNPKFIPTEKDQKEPSVSNIVYTLFEPDIERNNYNSSESKKHKFKVTHNKNHTQPFKLFGIDLSQFNIINSWSNNYKNDMQNFDNIDLEK